MPHKINWEAIGAAGTFVTALCAGAALYWAYASKEIAVLWEAVEALATIVAALFAGTAVIYARRGADHAVAALKSNQLMEVWQHCASRYDALKRDQATFLTEDSRRRIEEKKEREIRSELAEIHAQIRDEFWKNFWSRYWGLKNDQFDFWLYGYLDHDTFCDWAFSTLHTIKTRWKKPGDYFQASFREYVENAGTINPLFDDLILELERIANLTDKECAGEVKALNIERVIDPASLAEFDPDGADGIFLNNRIPMAYRYNLMVHYLTTSIVEGSHGVWKNRGKLSQGLDWGDHLKAVTAASNFGAHRAVERARVDVAAKRKAKAALG